MSETNEIRAAAERVVGLRAPEVVRVRSDRFAAECVVNSFALDAAVVCRAWLAVDSKLASLIDHYLSKGRDAESRGESKRAASYRSVANMLGVLLQGGDPIAVDFLARFKEAT